jgi:hypothetical protein
MGRSVIGNCGKEPSGDRPDGSFYWGPAVARDWLELHESGTYVKFTAAGADLFA